LVPSIVHPNGLRLRLSTRLPQLTHRSPRNRLVEPILPAAIQPTCASISMGTHDLSRSGRTTHTSGMLFAFNRGHCAVRKGGLMRHELTMTVDVGYCSYNTHTILGASPGSATVTDTVKSFDGEFYDRPPKPVADSNARGFRFERVRPEPFAILATEPVLSSPSNLYDGFDSLNRRKSSARGRRGERPMCTLAIRGRRAR